MDQCTHEVRAEYWKKIIQACGQRPAGQSANGKQWGLTLLRKNKLSVYSGDIEPSARGFRATLTDE